MTSAVSCLPNTQRMYKDTLIVNKVRMVYSAQRLGSLEIKSVQKITSVFLLNLADVKPRVSPASELHGVVQRGTE